MKYYLLKFSADYADEFDVEALKVFTELEYLKSLIITKNTLKKAFKPIIDILEEEAFIKERRYRDKIYDSDSKSYIDFTYDLYLTNPIKYNNILSPNSYEMGFGTNETIIWESEEQYWQDINIQEIEEDEYNTIIKLIGNYFGTGDNFFPLGYYDDDDE